MATEVQGADTMARTMKRARRQLGDLDQPAQELADDIRSDAARHAPRLTGALAASGRARKGVVTFGGGRVDYAAAQNFGVGPRVGLRGGHNIKPTRFFSRAVERARRDADDTYAPEVQATLNKVRGV